MQLFDTHAHLLDDRFDDDREELIARIKEVGVVHVLECACKSADIEKVIALCDAHPNMIYGAVGVHPHSASGFSPAVYEKIEAALSHPAVRAVGEIGLDYHYDFSPRDVQKTCFDAQLALANEKGYPVVIHDREAHGDTLDLLRLHKNGLRGVMHCFSGSWETAKACLDLGLHLGIGGSLTFKNAKKLVELVPKVPRDRLLLETDCPYMTPEPFRGKRNDPSLTKLTLARLALLRGEDEEELAAALLENGRRLFGI